MREFDCVLNSSFRRYSIITRVCVCVCVCVLCVCVRARDSAQLGTCARWRSSDALGFAPSSSPSGCWADPSAGEGWHAAGTDPWAARGPLHHPLLYSSNTIQAPHICYCSVTHSSDFRHFYHIILNYTLHISLSSPKTTKIRLLLCS